MMKQMLNGKIVDMTPEEEAEVVAKQAMYAARPKPTRAGLLDDEAKRLGFASTKEFAEALEAARTPTPRTL